MSPNSKMLMLIAKATSVINRYHESDSFPLSHLYLSRDIIIYVHDLSEEIASFFTNYFFRRANVSSHSIATSVDGKISTRWRGSHKCFE